MYEKLINIYYPGKVLSKQKLQLILLQEHISLSPLLNKLILFFSYLFTGKEFMNISHMEIHLIEVLYRNIVGEKTLSHVFIFKFKKNDFFLKSPGRGPFNMHWWGTML